MPFQRIPPTKGPPAAPNLPLVQECIRLRTLRDGVDGSVRYRNALAPPALLLFLVNLPDV